MSTTSCNRFFWCPYWPSLKLFIRFSTQIMWLIWIWMSLTHQIHQTYDLEWKPPISKSTGNFYQSSKHLGSGIRTWHHLQIPSCCSWNPRHSLMGVVNTASPELTSHHMTMPCRHNHAFFPSSPCLTTTTSLCHCCPSHTSFLFLSG
jgi:hypothetical protein